MDLTYSSSEAIGAFAKALAEMPDITKGRTADTGSYKYKYADLSDVLDAVKTTLAKHGLAVSQWPSDEGVHTAVMHDKGGVILFPPLKVGDGKGTPQQQGSAITYARRYALMSICGIATEDDDGKAASRPAPVPDPKKERIDALVEAMRALPTAAQGVLRDWAAGQDKALSPKALAADNDWLDEVEVYVGELFEGEVGIEPDSEDVTDG